MTKVYEVRVVDTEEPREHPLVRVSKSVVRGGWVVQAGPLTGRYGPYYRSTVELTDDECRALQAALNRVYPLETPR